MLRNIIWFVVAISILVVVYLTYEYNTQLQTILNSINFADLSSLIHKAKEMAEQNILSGDLLSGTTTIISGVVDTLSGTVATVISGSNEVLSGSNY